MYKSIKSLQAAACSLETRIARNSPTNASFETIAPFIEEIRQRFPMMGARQMVTTMRQDYTLKVSEYVTTWPFSWIPLITL